jgi:GNAT superfamily N-acetyltransferase
MAGFGGWKGNELGAPREILSRADVLEIARDLDYSKGRILDLAESKPWISRISRQAVEERTGAAPRVYRTVMVPEGASIERERVANATMNPVAAVKLSLELPGIVYRPGQVEIREPWILRYEIRPENVIAYVPALIDLAQKAFPDGQLRAMRFKTQRGSSMSVEDAFLEVLERGEDEILAEVSGIRPEILNFGSRHEAIFAQDVLTGRFRSGRVMMEEYKRDMMMAFPDPEEAAREYDRLAAAVRGFFGMESGGSLGSAGQFEVGWYPDRGGRRLAVLDRRTGAELSAVVGKEALAARFSEHLYGGLGSCILEEAGLVGFILRIDVPERWQGQGIGTDLLEEGLRQLKAVGVSAVLLDVYSRYGRHEDLVRFYERHGFVEVPGCAARSAAPAFIMRAAI